MPGLRSDRRCPARSAAWWGLALQSMSPSFASCLTGSASVRSPVFCPYCSAQHIPGRQRSLLRVVYATSETTHRRSVAATAAMRHTVPAPHRYSSAVLVAHRHRVSLTGHVPRLPSVDAFVTASLGFAPGPPRGMPGNVGPERYYVRMRPAWAREGDRPLVATLATARTTAAAAPAHAS